MISPGLQKDLEFQARTLEWYINTRWNDPAQKVFAQESIQQILAILTESKNDQVEEYVPPTWLISGDDFPIVGAFFTLEDFVKYADWVNESEDFEWEPTGITMHHTALPHLKMRPKGFKEKHMYNLRFHYRNIRKFDSGPHLFVDDNGIWVLTPLSHRGVHAQSFNHNRFGIEMLGDYQVTDDPDSGRGAEVIANGQFAAAALMVCFGVSKKRLNFHRHDPKTDKTCPGTKIDFKEFESGVHEIYEGF